MGEAFRLSKYYNSDEVIANEDATGLPFFADQVIIDVQQRGSGAVGGVMACKFLIPSKIATCLASDHIMVPSLFELLTFCHGDPTTCLIYQQKQSLLEVKVEKKEVISGPVEKNLKAS